MDTLNVSLILLIVLMPYVFVKLAEGQSCSILQKCSNCYLANQDVCRNNADVDEYACARFLYDLPNVQKTKFTPSFSTKCAYYTCTNTLLYIRSSHGTITYRLGCVNGCNNVTLTGYDNRGISDPADETIYSLTENECRSHCIDIAFNGTDCTAVYTSGVCYLYTSCPAGVCTTHYVSSSKVDQITCDYTVIKCSALSNPTNGMVTYSGVMAGASATYSCDTGYTPDSSIYRTCGNDGNWGGMEPSCNPVDCLSPWSISNGNVSVTGTTYLNTASYACNTGYTLSGSAVSTCREDSAWDGNQPSCNPVDCTSPWSISNGNVTVTGTTYLNTASYACNTGYTLSGSAVSTCREDGAWDGAQPSCNSADCSSPWSIVNGNVTITGTTYLDTATYTCFAGYTLSGTNVSTCGADNTWDGTQPNCNPVNCGIPSSILNGLFNVTSQYYPGTAIYSCDAGYILTGNSLITCQADGSWSNANTLCEPVDCGPPQNIANGEVNVTDTTYQHVAVYSCDSGQSLIGPNTRSCDYDGNWTGSDPYCVVDCGNPVAIADGLVTYNNTYLNSVAVYQCNTNCTLVGDNQTTCLSNGSWAILPSCSCPICLALSDPINGAVSTTNGNHDGSIASYSCTPGFVLSNVNVRECMPTGLWTSTEPTCDLPDPGNTASENAIYIMPCLCNEDSEFESLSQDEIIELLVQNTKIDEKSTALAQQKLKSINDPRESSKIIGTLGISIVSVVLGFVIVMDCLSAGKKICKSNKDDVTQIVST